MKLFVFLLTAAVLTSCSTQQGQQSSSAPATPSQPPAPPPPSPPSPSPAPTTPPDPAPDTTDPVVNRTLEIDVNLPGIAGKRLIALGGSPDEIAIAAGQTSAQVPVFESNRLVVLLDADRRLLYINQLKDGRPSSPNAATSAEFLVRMAPLIGFVIDTYGYEFLRQNIQEIRALEDTIVARIQTAPNSWGDPADEDFKSAVSRAVDGIVTYANDNQPPSSSTTSTAKAATLPGQDFKGYFTIPTSNDKSRLSVYGLPDGGARYQRAIVNRGARFVSAYDSAGNFLGLIPPTSLDDGYQPVVFKTAVINTPPTVDDILIYGMGTISTNAPNDRFLLPATANIIVQFAVPAVSNFGSQKCIKDAFSPGTITSPRGSLFATVYADLIADQDFQNSKSYFSQTRAAAVAIVDAIKDSKVEEVATCISAIAASAAFKAIASSTNFAVGAVLLSEGAINTLIETATPAKHLFGSKTTELFVLNRYLDDAFDTLIAPDDFTQGETHSRLYRDSAGVERRADMRCAVPAPPASGERRNLRLQLDALLNRAVMFEVAAPESKLTGTFNASKDEISISSTSEREVTNDPNGNLTYTSDFSNRFRGKYDRFLNQFRGVFEPVNVLTWNLGPENSTCLAINNAGSESGSTLDRD